MRLSSSIRCSAVGAGGLPDHSYRVEENEYGKSAQLTINNNNSGPTGSSKI